MTTGTALGLPQQFPERGMLLFAAFTVTLGTLLLQGLTLRPLVRAFDLQDDAPVDREMRVARAMTAEAALEAIGNDSTDGVDVLRREIEAERDIARDAIEGDGRPTFAIKELHEKAIAARRRRLFELRKDGTIGDDAFQRLEEEFDLAELAIGTRI